MINFKNIKIELTFSIIIFFISILFVSIAESADIIKMVESDEKGIVLEFQAQSFNVEKRVVDGITYQTISIDQLGNTRIAGMPQVPVRRLPIAIPPDAKPTLEVIDNEMMVYFGYLLHPVHENIVIENGINEKIEERFALNTSIYEKDTLYPRELVELVSSGYMRSQKVAQINIYPIQHNPVTGELRFYSKIRFKVNYSNKETSASKDTAVLSKEKSKGVYESILQNMLINYNPALKNNRKMKKKYPAKFQKNVGAGNEIFPPIKISIDEEGIFKIDYTDINKQELWGDNLEELDPRYLNLYNKGTEAAIFISGEEDGIFDEGDYILFYGIPMTGVYTETNVYWLTVGDVEGLRMEEVSSPPGSGDPVEYFKTVYHAEENPIWWSSRPGGLEKDHWFWKEFKKGSADRITYVAGRNETQEVLVDNIKVSDTTNGLNANALVLILPESYNDNCRVELEPRNVTVSSREQVTFNVNNFGDSCDGMSFEWHWWPLFPSWQLRWNFSHIGSSMEEGVYTAGVNNRGGSVTEGVWFSNEFSINNSIYDIAAVTVLPANNDCLLYMEPTSAVVQAGETLSFTASIDGQNCENSTHSWSYTSCAGSYIYYQNVDIPITLNNVLYPTDEDCLLRVSLMGKSISQHRTLIYLNEELVGDNSWSDQEESIFEINLPQALLNEGQNILSMIPVYDNGSSTDWHYLNWFEIEYLKSYSAKNENDEYAFPGNGEVIAIDGFTGDTVEVYDITNPYAVDRIVDFSVVQTGEGNFLVKFEDLRDEDLNYMVLTPYKWKSSTDMAIDIPSDLSAEGKGADYIIITYDGFYEEIQPLADYRINKGMTVETVKITDVYDEFNYGIFDPQAIKDFLTYAYENWDPVPIYVLLVGDANIDYKNRRSPDKNYVPTQMHVNNYGSIVLSDNWFVCVSGDDIYPDLFTARIPANTSNQVEYAVNKIIAYEEEEYSEWHQRAVFAADDDYPEFREISDDLIENYFPEYFDKEKIYLGPNPDNIEYIYDDADDARNVLIEYINEGAMVTHYSGHGQFDIWGSYNGRFFSSSYVNNLSNIDKPTFMISLTCNNGYFSYYHSRGPSLAETMLLAENKGAFACFAASTLGNTNNEADLTRSLFDEIFYQEKTSLGAATSSAKIVSYYMNGDDDIIQSFTLFGDPATVLKDKLGPKTPRNPSPSRGEIGISQTPTLSWDTGNPDIGDPVVYDIYFGEGNNPEVVSEGQSDTTYTPGSLDLSTTYYWKVKARNLSGESSTSPLWDFTVQGDPIVVTTSTTTSINTIIPTSTTTISDSTSTSISTSTTTTIDTKVFTTTTTTSVDSTTTTTITSGVPKFICPLSLALGGKSKEANLLRRVRDEIIDKEVFGRQYIRLYYKHYIEISLILLEDRNIRDKVKTLAKRLLLDIPSHLEKSRLSITKEMVTEITSLFDLLEQRSGNTLKADIIKIKRDLKKGEILKKLNITVTSLK